MKKSEKSDAKRLLMSLKYKIGIVETAEPIRILEEQLKAQLFSYREKEFSEWYRKLPENFFNYLNNDFNYNNPTNWLNTFCPSLFFQRNLEWVNVLFSIEETRKHIQDYKVSSLHEVTELERQLEFIVENDKNSFFKLFQSADKKSSVETAKQFVLANHLIIEKLDSQLSVWSQLKIPSLEDFERLADCKREYAPMLASGLGFVTPDYEEYGIQVCDNGIAKLQQLVKNCSKEALVEKIILAWNELKKRQADKDVVSLTVDILETISDEKLEFLDSLKLGYDRLIDIQHESINQLSANANISQSEAKLVKELTEQTMSRIQETAYPKLNPDNLQDIDYRLLQLLKIYREYPEDREEREKYLKDRIQSWITQKEDLKRTAFNRYHANLLDREAYLQWCEKEMNLYSSYVQVTSEKYDISPLDNNALDNRNLKSDFIKNSATYYALIEQLTGSKRVYTPNDLPSLIVEAVTKTEVNKKSLSVIMRSYQEFGVKYSLYYKHVLLGDEMGLGKTIQAIAIANHLFQANKKNSIVIAPLSVLDNWKREVEKWSGLSTFVFRGKERLQVFNSWQAQGGVLLTNYEQCKFLVNSMPTTIIHFLVVDEAHFIKNPGAKRTIAVTTLSKQAEYRLFMSGTPLENKVREMKHLINVLNPRVARQLEREAFLTSDDFKYEVATVYLRRKREEVLDELPSLNEIQLWSSFSEEQQQFYNEAVRDGLAGLMRMRRAAFYGSDSQKIQQIKDICKEAKENGLKVIVFSFFKDGVLYKLLDELPDVAPLMISGDISPSQRQSVIDDFSENPNQTVLLSQIDSGGTGLNIQAANIVILCEPQWKPSTENQAISRAYRMGQTRNVTVYRLLTEKSIDESMTELLSKKIGEFNLYANDSDIADAFSHREEFEKNGYNEKQVQQQILELERRRLETTEKSRLA